MSISALYHGTLTALLVEAYALGMRRKVLVLAVLVVALLWPVTARADECLVQVLFIHALCVPEDPTETTPGSTPTTTTTPMTQTTLVLPATR